jgi:hypothetical protein
VEVRVDAPSNRDQRQDYRRKKVEGLKQKRRGLKRKRCRLEREAAALGGHTSVPKATIDGRSKLLYLFDRELAISPQ